MILSALKDVTLHAAPTDEMSIVNGHTTSEARSLGMQ